MSYAAETNALDRIVPELQAEGYEVFVRPQKTLVPSFMGEFSPDAIAIRSDKNLLIEVVHKSAEAAKKLEQITALLRGHDEWELRVIWVAPEVEISGLTTQDAAQIKARILEIKELAFHGHYEPAMLMAWATLEALTRAVLTTQMERAQTTGRLIQVLATEGYLTPSEADSLRGLAEKRNKLSHGELQVRISSDELEDLIAILDVILLQLAPDSRPQ